MTAGHPVREAGDGHRQLEIVKSTMSSTVWSSVTVLVTRASDGSLNPGLSTCADRYRARHESITPLLMLTHLHRD